MASAAPLAPVLAEGADATRLPRLEIVTPAAPGSGWSQTAEAMKRVLETEDLVGRVDILRIPGAGGTVGLSRFVHDRAGRADSLLLTGLVMVGAILANRPEGSLEEVTPIARLAGDFEVVVVSTGSAIGSLAELMTRLGADPATISWAGGSLGGTDHILAALLTRHAGGDPARMRYAPYSGGGDALPALTSGAATVGVNSYQEFAGAIAAGRLRALAISAPERVPGIDIPTFKEQGVEVELVDWRGVVAAPGLEPAEARKLGELIGRMVATPAWKKVLAERRWQDLYQPAAEFDPFLSQESDRVQRLLTDAGLIK